MRIHFFVRGLNEKTGGGSHHNAIQLIRFLKDAGHRVVVHAFASTGNQPPDDIEIVEDRGGAYGFVAAQNFLVKVLRGLEDDADLFFLYGTDFSWGGGKYRMHGGTIPTVVYLDSHLGTMNVGERLSFSYHLKRTLWDKLIGLRYTKYVDKFLVVSPFLKMQYVRFGFPERLFFVVPNFFEPAIFMKEAHTEASGSTLQFLYAGRIIYDKGVDLLIRAVAMLPPDSLWSLHIVGDGPHKEECMRLADSLGISSKITFISWLNATELSKEYEQADIFVHPARIPEPFGRTVVEAMAYGIPAIVPQSGGAAWIVDDPSLTFENGNAYELCRVLRHLLDDPAFRLDTGRKMSDRVQFFAKENTGAALTKALGEVVRIPAI